MCVLWLQLASCRECDAGRALQFSLQSGTRHICAVSRLPLTHEAQRLKQFVRAALRESTERAARQQQGQEERCAALATEAAALSDANGGAQTQLAAARTELAQRQEQLARLEAHLQSTSSHEEAATARLQELGAQAAAARDDVARFEQSADAIEARVTVADAALAAVAERARAEERRLEELAAHASAAEAAAAAAEATRVREEQRTARLRAEGAGAGADTAERQVAGARPAQAARATSASERAERELPSVIAKFERLIAQRAVRLCFISDACQFAGSLLRSEFALSSSRSEPQGVRAEQYGQRVAICGQHIEQGVPPHIATCPATASTAARSRCGTLSRCSATLGGDLAVARHVCGELAASRQQRLEPQRGVQALAARRAARGAGAAAAAGAGAASAARAAGAAALEPRRCADGQPAADCQVRAQCVSCLPRCLLALRDR